MTIDTTYMMNRTINPNFMGSGVNIASMSNANPFIANMQIQASAMAANYKKMYNALKQLQEQSKIAMQNAAASNQTYNSNIYNTNLFNTNLFNTTNNSVTTTNLTNQSSSFNMTLDDSDLKPGLFKGRLAGQEALVTRLCRKYGVNPGLVAAIIGLESGWGTSNLAMHNNFGGVRKAGDLGANEKGFGYFSTIEKGLEAMIANLAKYPQKYSDVKAVDFNNLDAIGRHYCDASWASQVREVYSKNVKSYLA